MISPPPSDVLHMPKVHNCQCLPSISLRQRLTNDPDWSSTRMTLASICPSGGFALGLKVLALIYISPQPGLVAITFQASMATLLPASRV